MPASRFFRYELRTTDVDAALAFYTGVLGSQFWDGDVSVTRLAERAAAMGAPAHWLGHVGVGDVGATAARIVTLGGQQLGPAQRAFDGSPCAVVRDPFGAVMAVSSEGMTPRSARVVWHLHHSEDHERAFAVYSALFGWRAAQCVDLGSQLGIHQTFAWDESGQTVGSMANTARLPRIHPQWLFFVRVADIEDALTRVEGCGGTALEPTRTASHDIVAPCNDLQGAAFGLYQVARES